MSDFFLKICNMAINGGWVALAIILLRPFIYKVPKYIRPILWAFVGIRLIFPIKLESVLSLIPSSETIPSDIVYSKAPTIHSGLPFLNSTVNPIISGALAPNPTESVNPVQIILFIGSIIWIIGISAMLIYSTVSFLKLRIRVRESVWDSENIYICDRISTPFILGIIKPKIYIPSSMAGSDKELVSYHEKAHLERRDHLWKPLGFLLLSVYWFNPILWFSFVLFCKDIELATDEKVIRERGNAIKKEYSAALLSCSAPQKFLSACPLAFGETGVKSRIKSVLNYKKPAFWVVLVSLILCVAVAVCFLTNPKDKWKSENYGITGTVAAAEYGGIVFEVVSASINSEFPHIEVRWKNKTDKTLSYGQPYSLFKGDEELEVKENMVWELPLYTLFPGEEALYTFNLDYYDISQNGTYRLESWFGFLESSNMAEKYRAYVEFKIDRRFSFVGKAYRGEELVFDNGVFSSVIFTDYYIPEFMISDDNCHLLTNMIVTSFSSSRWTDLGELDVFKLSKPTWDEVLSASLWDSGYSAEILRKNNLNAFRVINYEQNMQAYLLEQKNGDIYIAYGHTDPFVIRWIFKMREMDFSYQYWDKNEPQINYVCETSNDPIMPTLTLYPEIKKFRFSFSSLSSYIPMGDYEESANEIICTATANGTKLQYYFLRDGKNLLFDSTRSAVITKYRYESGGEPVASVIYGSVFKMIENQTEE